MGIEISNVETIHNDLLQRIREIWEAARGQAVRSVNTAHVCANWLIGQQIIQAEQGGAERAGYGTALLQNLSQQLTRDYGSGFSISSLQYMRAFYINYPQLLTVEQIEIVSAEHDSRDPSQRIQHASRVIFPPIPGTKWKPGQLHPALSWTHYRALLLPSEEDLRAELTRELERLDQSSVLEREKTDDPRRRD